MQIAGVVLDEIDQPSGRAAKAAIFAGVKWGQFMAMYSYKNQYQSNEYLAIRNR
jgi:hypothetical protein